jgi:ATP-dependent DNA helicase RecG
MDMLSKSLSDLKEINSKKAQQLENKLKVSSIRDLMNFFPIKYENYSKIFKVEELKKSLPNFNVRLVGKVNNFYTSGIGKKKRLVAVFSDNTGSIDLVWFKGIQWINKLLKINNVYIITGKINNYAGTLTMPHPSVELYDTANVKKYESLMPVYGLTNQHINNRFIIKLIKDCFMSFGRFINENIPDYILDKYNLLKRSHALYYMHFPKTEKHLSISRYRLKFEELFYLQLMMLKVQQSKLSFVEGLKLKNTDLVQKFYNNHLTFTLTSCQQKAIKQIYYDMSSGKQMNRLLQGDVGSGKTIVGFISMLIPIADGFQVAMMAPTSILAEQHYQTIKKYAEPLGITVDLLIGSTSLKQKKIIQSRVETGETSILVGTHALIYDNVKFKNLAYAVIDEQHKFGVSQRSKLWEKNLDYTPHVLVMTATPIPRTMAMVFYNDLDISTLKEMPKGRLPIKTIHCFDSQRLNIFRSIQNEIDKGRQVYVVYPFIEESEKFDYKDLIDGYESLSRAFPNVPIGILHGKMKPEDKEYEMTRFINNETKILVCTTVIEVGINVPNATLIVIESAERFGLAQLHQLRGRVGRSTHQSYCILVTNYKLTNEARQRMNTMTSTGDGFEIADMDLKIRGPGNIAGVQQSGIVNLKIASFQEDQEIVVITKRLAKNIIENDPNLEKLEHLVIKNELENGHNYTTRWFNIS